MKSDDVKMIKQPGGDTSIRRVGWRPRRGGGAGAARQRLAGRRGGRRAFATAVVALLAAATFAVPAHAADGYSGNFNGDEVFTVTRWDPSQGRFVPDPTPLKTEGNEFRTVFDQAWSKATASSPGNLGYLCGELERRIQAADRGFLKTDHCTPTAYSQADLYVEQLGTNLVGFRYFVPGLGRSIYAYDHNICLLGECVAERVDVSFDLTIDVAVRVAPGVGPESTTSISPLEPASSFSPLSIQSARLSFSNASFTSSVCTDACAEAERTLNSTVIDLADQLQPAVSYLNDDFHNVISVPDLNQYLGLGVSLSATAVQFELRKDEIPALAYNKPVAALGWRSPFAQVRAIYAVGTDGHLWDQVSYSNGPYGHWADLGAPPGTTIASAPAAVVGSDAMRHLFVRAANGHLYELFDGRNWIDRGRPPGTSAVGTPAAAISGALPEVVTRGANGDIELLTATAANTWRWLDLGTPGGATLFRPQIVVGAQYMAVAVITSTSHLAVREANGTTWSRWRDLGVFPARPTSDPSTTINGSRITVYVTGADHRIEQASFVASGAASFEPIAAYRNQSLPLISSAPAAVLTATGDPTIFAVDTAGQAVQLVWTRQPVLGLFSGFTSRTYGTLLDTKMRAPTALSALGSISGFQTAANAHLAETTASGRSARLIDHTAASSVVYQAHTLGATAWDPHVDEGQSALAHTFDSDTGGLRSALDGLRVQSTGASSIRCQANQQGLGWRPAVEDGQTCGGIL